MYQIGLACSYYLSSDCKTYLDDYSWWTSIVEQLCKKSNFFEIRCWPGEEEAIETGTRYGNPVDNNETRELVFKGRITDEFVCEILNNYLNKDKRLKWFTLVLYKDETIMLLSEHYGSEAYLLNIPNEELSSYKLWTKQYSCIKITLVAEMNG